MRSTIARSWPAATAVVAALLTWPAAGAEPDTAVELFGRWRGRHGEALLVVDQFEELITLSPAEVQERFAGLLGRLAADADVHVVLSVRDDFLIRCHEEAPLARVFEHLTPILPLGGDDLGRAVEEPAKKGGYR